MTRRTAWAGVLVVALALTSCTGSEETPTAGGPALVGQRLTELAQEADAFSRLDVGDEELAAWAVRDGELRHWRLAEGTSDSRSVEQEYPAVDFSGIDPAELQTRVEALAEGCDGANFRVTVQALTPSALVSELRCGDEEFEALGGADPVAVHLGDAALPDYGGLTVEETWDQLLAQAAVLDPSLRFTSLSLDEERIGFGLSAASATNGCQPAVDIARDGTDLAWRCDTPSAEPPVDLARFSAGELAALQQQAMSDVGVVDPAGVEVTIGRDLGGTARMTVRQGTRLSEVPLG